LEANENFPQMILKQDVEIDGGDLPRKELPAHPPTQILAFHTFSYLHFLRNFDILCFALAEGSIGEKHKDKNEEGL
jgi:hypothetical protein